MIVRIAAAVFVLGSALLAESPARATTVQTLAAVKGATTWFVEDHGVPMIAMDASVPAGSAYDPSGKAGLSTFAAAMLDEGAGKLGSRAFQDALASRAIQLSVTPGKDYLEISLVTLSENADEAFRLLGLALQHPRFDADAVARVRAQMVQDVLENSTDPETVAQKAFDVAYFGRHPYAHPSDGYVAGLSAISAADLRAFARANWVRGGLKIAVAGDTTTKKLSALLATAFARLPGTTPARVPPAMPPAVHRIEIVRMDVPQPNVFFGFPAIPRKDRDYIAAYVANCILGDGDFTSRLTQEVRVKRGLTYGISTELATYRGASLIEGEVATRRKDVMHAIAVTREVIAKLGEKGPTAQELADAKSYLTGSYPLAFDSDVDIAAQLAAFQRQGLEPDYVTKRNGLINAVTLEDVRRVAKRLFDPARLTIVVAGTPGGPASPSGPRRR